MILMLKGFLRDEWKVALGRNRYTFAALGFSSKLPKFVVGFHVNR